MNLKSLLHHISKSLHGCVIATAVLFTLSLLSPNANGDIIVKVQDNTITAGGTGFIGVLISSSGTDILTYASYDFNISVIGGPVSTLEFTSPQDLTEDTDTSYVFSGANFGINPITLTNSQFVADDGHTGAGTTLSSEFLLARPDLTHILGLGQLAVDAAGEQFQITLDELSPDTLFLNENGDPLAIDAVNSHLTATITVTSAAAAAMFPSFRFRNGKLICTPVITVLYPLVRL